MTTSSGGAKQANTNSRHVFISYSHDDQEFVRRLVDLLTQAHLAVWVDTSNIPYGAPNWETPIREGMRGAGAAIYVGSPSAAASLYVGAEMVAAEVYQVPTLPVWAAGDVWVECAPLSLAKAQYIDARTADAWAARSTAIITTLQGWLSSPIALAPPPEPATTPAPLRNPYIGLRSFEAADARYFFGRDDERKQMLALVEERRFVAVLGASGSGKSSLIKAGVLSALDDHTWLKLEMVPDDRPILNLSNAIADSLGNAISDVERDLLRADGRGLRLYAERLNKRHQKPRTLLFIDQFEEVFTRASSEEEKRAFLNLLAQSTQSNNAGLAILITMRADFYDRPMQHPVFYALIKDHFSLVAMASHGLRQAIEAPAQAVGLALEPGLSGDLIYELRDEPGALPLLQFTLEALYRKCIDEQKLRRLTLSAYTDLGGVRGGLATYAETAYQGLAEEDKVLAQFLFTRLIEPGSGDHDSTRRRALQSELVLADTSATARLRAVMLKLTDARLLVTNNVKGQETVEIAHEVLIKAWPRLAEWVQQLQAGALLLRLFRLQVNDWLAQEKAPQFLLRAEQFSRVQKAIQMSYLSADETEFLNQSSILAKVEVLRTKSVVLRNSAYISWSKHFPDDLVVRFGNRSLTFSGIAFGLSLVLSIALGSMGATSRGTRVEDLLYAYSFLALLFSIAILFIVVIVLAMYGQYLRWRLGRNIKRLLRELVPQQHER